MTGILLRASTAGFAAHRPALISAVLLAVLAVAGCPPPQGTETGPCYPNSTCDTGLTCASDICVRVAGDGDGDGDVGDGDGDGDGDIGDGDGDGDGDPGPDVPVDDSGFAVFEPVEGESLVVYVSSSEGNDANDGLTKSAPKATLAAGIAATRVGAPDHLMLKRGDTWVGEELYLTGHGGPSVDRPYVITSYGDPEDPRPLLLTGVGNGVHLNFSDSHNNVAVTDIAFEAHFRNPNRAEYNPGAPFFNDGAGINATTSASSNLYFEGLTFSWFTNGAIVQNVSGDVITDVTIRRCVFRDTYTTGDFSQGLYFYAVDGVLVEESVIDRTGAIAEVGREGTVFDHSIYLQNHETAGANTVVRGNIFARGDGIQLREGGLAENNLFTQTWIALQCGDGNDANPAGVSCQMRDNVILDGTDINSTDMRGWGIRVSNIEGNGGSVIDGNVVAHAPNAGFPLPFTIEGGATYENGVHSRVRDLTMTNNVVYNWRGWFQFMGPADRFSDLVFEGNRLVSNTSDIVFTLSNAQQGDAFTSSANNQFWNATGNADQVVAIDYIAVPFNEWQSEIGDASSAAIDPGFPDPSRQITTYNSVVLERPSETEDFLSQVRQQRKGNWRPAYTAAVVNDWIREGYGL